MTERIEITIEATNISVHPTTEKDLPWPQLMKIARANQQLLDKTRLRLIKARAQKNEWKRKYEELYEHVYRR